MNWLNIELSTLRSESYIGAEPLDRATWLNLTAYCCDQENGGTIEGAGSWGERKWMQLAGVTLEEAHRECGLFVWDGDNLTITFYPADKEAEVQAKRKAGRTSGRKKGTPNLPKSSSASSSAHSSVNTEGKGKEVERKENKTKEPREKSALEIEREIVYKELRERIRVLCGRKPETGWDTKELNKLRVVARRDGVMGELEEIELFYSRIQKKFRKQSIATLLNQWTRELDRAANWTPDNPSQPSLPTQTLEQRYTPTSTEV